LALALPWLVRADDWPRWRGPNSDSICRETGLLKSWPKNGPKLLWTAKNLGTGFGTPSVAAGMIFGAGTRDGKDGAWALKESVGSPIWFTPIAEFKTVGPQNNGPCSTPTYQDGKLYLVTVDGTLGCLEATSGKLLWKKSYTKDFGGSVPSWGYSDSVLVDGDKVICAPSGPKAAVVALKASTGDVIWKTPIGPAGSGAGYASPIKATIAGVPMYIALLGKTAGIVGVHAETGKLLWQYNESALGGTAQISSPVTRGDKVWFSTSYGGGSALLQLTPDGTDNFHVKVLKTYEFAELNNHHGGVILLGDYLYFGHDQNNGIPACVRFETGEIVWKAKKRLPDGGGSSAWLYADGLLYIRYDNGLLALVKPSPVEKEFKVVSSFKLPAADEPGHKEGWPHPVIANGRLYIRDQRVMYCYDVKAK
jgi:outer membrane protein assembly factor BamB